MIANIVDVEKCGFSLAILPALVGTYNHARFYPSPIRPRSDRSAGNHVFKENWNV